LIPQYWHHKSEKIRSDLLLWNPLGYGATSGRRSAKADQYAMEAVLKAAMDQGYKKKNISLVGMSIGSGAVCRLAAKYKLKQAILIVPFATLEGTMRRLARNSLISIGDHLIKTGKWRRFKTRFLGEFADKMTRPVRGILREEFEYDNVVSLREAAKSGVKRLAILERRGDILMTSGSLMTYDLSSRNSEARQLQKAWDENRGNKPKCIWESQRGDHNFCSEWQHQHQYLNGRIKKGPADIDPMFTFIGKQVAN